VFASCSDPSGLDPCKAGALVEGWQTVIVDGHYWCVETGGPTLPAVVTNGSGNGNMSGANQHPSDRGAGISAMSGTPTGGGGRTPSAVQEQHKTRLQCGIAVASLALATIETGLLLPEIIAAEGALVAGGAVLGEMVGFNAVANNTNRAVSLMMLHHMRQFSEGALVANSLGEGYGTMGYLKEITPGVNVYFGYKTARENCQ